MADCEQSSNAEPKKKLIINYLPQCMLDQELMTLFSTVGQLESAKIMRDHQSGYSFGYGFVTYVNNSDAETAISEFNGYHIKGKTLKVSYSRPPGQEIRDTNLYIQNLPKTYQEQDVEQLFAEFGTIVQKSVLTDKITGMPRGVAFVRFNKKSEADAAISALNGQQLDGSLLPLNIKVAEEHGKQKAAYYAGLKSGMFVKNRGGMAGGPQFPMHQNHHMGIMKHGRGAGVLGGDLHYGGPGGGGSRMMGRDRYNPMGRGGGGFGFGGGGNVGYSPRFQMY